MKYPEDSFDLLWRMFTITLAVSVAVFAVVCLIAWLFRGPDVHAGTSSLHRVEDDRAMCYYVDQSQGIWCFAKDNK